MTVARNTNLSNYNLELAAIIVSIGSAFYAASCGKAIHQENLEAAERNLTLVERQLAIMEQQHIKTEERKTTPNLVLHLDADGNPNIINVGEVSAKCIFLHFYPDSKDGPGSFCYVTGSVLRPQHEVLLSDLLNQREDFKGSVQITAKGPTGESFTAVQSFACTWTHTKQPVWWFGEIDEANTVDFTNESMYHSGDISFVRLP